MHKIAVKVLYFTLFKTLFKMFISLHDLFKISQFCSKNVRQNHFTVQNFFHIKTEYSVTIYIVT